MPSRFERITLTDGTKFILRITRETSSVVVGIEVDREGDEVRPTGFDERLRVVGTECIAKRTPMVMDNRYGTLKAMKHG